MAPGGPPVSVDLIVRPLGQADVPSVIGLYEEAGLGGSEISGAPEQEVLSKMERDPDLFLVGEIHGEVVATVMGTWDGHRGRIKRLAVRGDLRRGGYGRRMVAELERRFAERGITQLRLEVWAHNSGGLTFWEQMGYVVEPEIRYFVRSLVDGPD